MYTARLTGETAVRYASENDLKLCKYSDPVEDAREDVTTDEAVEIMREDPNLVYIDVVRYDSPSDAWDHLIGGQGAEEFMIYAKGASIEEVVREYLDNCPIDLYGVDVEAAQALLEQYIKIELGEVEPLEHVAVKLYGRDVDYEAATYLMDDDIRESLHLQMAPCTPQEFLDAYIIEHKKKFDEDFELR